MKSIENFLKRFDDQSICGRGLGLPSRCYPAAVSSLADRWTLDPQVTFLNHGSFGACPRAVLDAQGEWRARLEREPVRFFVRDLERLLDEVRGAIAGFVGADADDLALVPNATTAANAVLGSLAFEPGDEIVCTDHGYNAVANVLRRTAERTGARVVVARVPFPLAGPDEVVAAVLAAVGPRTRLAVLDHITSPTALVFPIAELVAALAERGVDTFVDGAHGPGQVPLDLGALGAAYYTGNFHKWCCAPKGAAMLHVRRDRQAGLRPAVISHGANSPRTDRSRFRLEFDWTGTSDPTAILCVPTALRVLAELVPGGWPMIMAQNHALAVAGRREVAEELDLPIPCPEDMLGAMAALPLPDGPATPPRSSLYADALQDALVEAHHVQLPIIPWPAPPKRLVRLSAHLYNEPAHYDRLAVALRRALVAEGSL
jgi:isopenicillin-N epimerase